MITVRDAKTPKQIVGRFNMEVIQNGDRKAFEELVAPGFINRSAPPGGSNGPEGLWNTFHTMLRPALSNLIVTIHDQVSEGGKVVTRKTIAGTHSGRLMEIAPAGRAVAIEVIDIVRIEDGRYVEHWGVNTLPALLAPVAAGLSSPPSRRPPGAARR
ncbi:ester cyclase [Teichococcus vastitatis]|nr:ester cyclase [Pseudoroseomonas vastitatis]